MQDFRTLPQFDDHEMLIALSDEKASLKAFVGVHRTINTLALGGTRLLAYSSTTAAIRDALNLSRAMSYKCALAGLPYGGGKAVIMLPKSFDRAELLQAYAKLVNNLRGTFRTGTDVGISDEDVALMSRTTKYMLGQTAGDRSLMSTSSTAALGVYITIKTCLQKYYSKEDISGRTVAVKGVGKLGGELARLLIEDGVQVVVSDVDASRLNYLQNKLPKIKVVENDTIHTLEVDVYAPCALGDDITEENVSSLKAKIVAGGANNQLSSLRVAQTLHEKGIVYIPDYIANAGGLIYVADELEADGFNRSRVIKRTQAIGDTVAEMIDVSVRKNVSPINIADEIAVTRIAEMKKSYDA